MIYCNLIRLDEINLFVQKRAIVTSALPYANGEIHLGHIASTYLPADVTVRFLKQNDVRAYYFCASDDYGTPILLQSEKKGITPEQYVSEWNKRDAEDFAKLDINFDLFYHTSSDENNQFVQNVFTKLSDAGHITQSIISQFYCKQDDKFLPDRYVKGTCPHCRAADQYSDLCESCGRIPEEILDPKCAICGKTPTQKESLHYFFQLEHFTDKLNHWLDCNDNLQSDVKNYVRNWIKEGLKDWDITRDISWGVPIPASEGADKVFYGWFDNHLAYISTAIKYLESIGEDGEKFWNSADIYHFIGKDIVYHHYLFLPAIRMGVDEKFKLPDYIPTRGHLTLQNKKISKSRNWYVGLRDFLQYYPADYLRFYLIFITPFSQNDLNFDWDDFASRINSELIGNIGNFINRTLGFTCKEYGGLVPKPDDMTSVDLEAREEIMNISTIVADLVQNSQLDHALKRILKFSAYFNQYFQHSSPWKGGVGSATCIYLSVNAVRCLSILLHCILPQSSQRIWEQLNLSDLVSDVSWNNASSLSISPGHVVSKSSPLFAKVEQDDINMRKSELK